MTFNYIFFKF